MHATPQRLFALGVALVSLLLWQCHADKDDAAGQAKQLKDENPLRQREALQNINRLYTSRLSKNNAQRDHKEVEAVRKAVCTPLVSFCKDAADRVRETLLALETLAEMQHLCALDAFVGALAWRPGMTEEHAALAARALAKLEIPDARKAEVTKALDAAYEKVEGKKGLHNRMRRWLIGALDALDHPSTEPVLQRIAITHKPEQNFLFNRLATEALADVATKQSLESMIEGLFWFAPPNANQRINDAAVLVLMHMGKVAQAPLMKVLRGKHERANTMAQAWLSAAQQVKQPEAAAAAAELKVADVVQQEASYALGQLGYPEALDSLLGLVKSGSSQGRLAAALALVRLNLTADRDALVMKALRYAYEKSSDKHRPQLLEAVKYTYGAGDSMSFLGKLVSNKKASAPLRVMAMSHYALLATKSAVPPIMKVVAAEAPVSAGGYRENFEATMPVLDVAKRCDEDLGCYKDTLKSKQVLEVRKAIVMLARLGQGKAEVCDALVPLLGHPDFGVRREAAKAIDYAASQGSPKALALLESLARDEEGKAVWKRFRGTAMLLEQRLLLRSH